MFASDNDSIIRNICQQYGRTAESLQEDVRTLQNWMKTQPHLPETLDATYTRNILFCTKFRIELAKQALDKYYTLPTRVPEFFGRINPKCPNMRLAAEIMCWVPLPKLIDQKYRVLLFKMMNQDLAHKMEPSDFMGMLIHLHEIRMQEDVTFRNVIIIDMEGLSYSLIAKLSPTTIFGVGEKIYSMALEDLYFVNSVPFVGTILALIKRFMKPKVFQRIHVCPDTSILKEKIPPKVLPEDYGGEEKSVQELSEMLQLKLVQYGDRFERLGGMKVDKSLRPEPLKNDEFLGYYGNFKKLDVD